MYYVTAIIIKTKYNYTTRPTFNSHLDIHKFDNGHGIPSKTCLHASHDPSRF